MANKKYISFDLENDEDKKVVVALGRIQTFLGLTSKEVVKKAVEELTQGDEYKQGIKDLIAEAEKELSE